MKLLDDVWSSGAEAREPVAILERRFVEKTEEDLSFLRIKSLKAREEFLLLEFEESEPENADAIASDLKSLRRARRTAEALFSESSYFFIFSLSSKSFRGWLFLREGESWLRFRIAVRCRKEKTKRRLKTEAVSYKPTKR